MQVQVTSRDEITVKVNANELSLISYALSFFGSQTKNHPRWHQGDAERAEAMGDQLFHAYTVVPDEEVEDSRNARLIDSGYDAYAREEGYYDLPDNY